MVPALRRSAGRESKRAASEGSIVADDRSRTGARISRSSAESRGMRAYIMTMPDTNQATNSNEPVMPSQRCV